MKYKVIVITNDKKFITSDFDSMFDANDMCDMCVKKIIASNNMYNVACITMYEIMFNDIEVMRTVYFN